MASEAAPAAAARPAKLHGRAFYESIGSPKYIVAPMVDQSEFAWRMLTRSFLPEDERSSVLAYSPMLHARLFSETQKYRDTHFQPTTSSMLPSDTRYHSTKAAAAAQATPEEEAPAPYLDGNPAFDRPLFVQFCANDPDALLAGARLVAPHCDAVDLNFGCPQGIARKGHYGAFLQEEPALVQRLVRTLHEHLPVPVTAKIRVLATPEATLAYARGVLDAGASILTVHGRRREQKGHLTGVADWAHIRYLREHLPPATVLFANGNVLQHGDLARCLEATGADGVMSAEGNLSDPALFAPPPPPGREGREYWRGRDGRGGWRVDAVVRRYLDIMHRYVVGREPPERRPLFMPGDDESWLRKNDEKEAREEEEEEKTKKENGGGETAPNGSSESQEPARKKRRKDGGGPDAANGKSKGKGDRTAGGGKMSSVTAGPNFVGLQAHLFHLLRHFVTRHHDVRDALARSRLGDLSVTEGILDMVERRVAEGLLEYERTGGRSVEDEDLARNGAYDRGSRGEARPSGAEAEAEAGAGTKTGADESGGRAVVEGEAGEGEDDPDSSVATVRRCKRPWWVVQPIVRPLPKEAMAKGAISLSKKEKQKLAEAEAERAREQVEGAAAATTAGGAHPAAAAAAGAAVQTNGKETTAEQATETLEKATDFQESGLVSG